MTRSKWKIPFINYNLLKKIIKKNPILKTHSRSTLIVPSFIGLEIMVHTGRRYKKILIEEKMVGHKLGEFAYTRKVGKIHTLNK